MCDPSITQALHEVHVKDWAAITLQLCQASEHCKAIALCILMAMMLPLKLWQSMQAAVVQQQSMSLSKIARCLQSQLKNLVHLDGFADLACKAFIYNQQLRPTCVDPTWGNEKLTRCQWLLPQKSVRAFGQQLSVVAEPSTSLLLRTDLMTLPT